MYVVERLPVKAWQVSAEMLDKVGCNIYQSNPLKPIFSATKVPELSNRIVVSGEILRIHLYFYKST